MIRAKISGVGSFLPEKLVTNDDLALFLDTSDEWIRSRTGIRTRHLLGPEEIPSKMGVEAARRALEMACLDPEDLDILIVATNVPEDPIPGTAPFIAQGLGLEDAAFLDITAGCAGFVYGLALAGALIGQGLSRRALVVGIEALSRFLNWSDRATCVLFGDGAGAAVVTPSSGESGILGVSLHGDPTKLNLLRIEAGGVRLPASADTVNQGLHFLKMEGEGLFRPAVSMMAKATREAADRAGITLSQIDWLIPHQANLRIVEAMAKRLRVPLKKVVVNIDRVANTSAASVPIALDELVREGKVEAGQVLALTAFGAGACYGTVILRW